MIERATAQIIHLEVEQKVFLKFDSNTGMNLRNELVGLSGQDRLKKLRQIEEGRK